MSVLGQLIDSYRQAAQSEREKGTYFEELILCYLRNEATYKDLYSQVWTYAQWAAEQAIDRRDAGIDLVAKTHGTGEYHAIQCKLYASDYRLQKSDIDSFFTASGKRPFSRRIIVSTTNHWTEHAEDALRDQQPPVTKIDLFDLENSQIDWSRYRPKQQPVLRDKKRLRPHQQQAHDRVLQGLEEADRGKLIMACGTGKTFTSLKIAESLAGRGKRVLFLVPSLALLSQSLTEWTQESSIPLHSFAVCSDSDVGKKRKKDDDTVQTFAHELRYPATTDPKRLATEMAKRHDTGHMSVVFSTYHSIDVIHQAQKDHGLAAFDLVVCDEAHRTTGATFDDEDESSFVKVHDAAYIQAAKRLYMTATPRIYGDAAKGKAEKENVALCSMDDESLYGPELHVITFSEAVKRGLLVDYKVIVLAVEESHVSRRIQGLLKDENNQLKLDDAAKIVGCWKALSKQDLAENLPEDDDPMRRAVAFCQVIDIPTGARTHKVSSKNIASMFQSVVEAYQESAEEEEAAVTLACEADHVDGAMNASQKEAKLAWLKEEPPEDTCRILSNVRCLSEGVDVPALDAVLFLTPRNSQVDVVQSVGRVMRNAPGKRRGYVVLPVVIPAGVEPHEALNDNQTYKVVWQVLQALRSHDDRFDAMVNKLELNGPNRQKMEVIAVTDKIEKKRRKTPEDKKSKAKGQYSLGEPKTKPWGKESQEKFEFEIGEIEQAIYAKLVQKVGNRAHWEDWANDIARIARTHIDRIRGILGLPPETEGDNSGVQPDPSNAAKTAFINFAKELRDDLNDSISDAEIVEMLAQHLITKPVFDALFDNYSFASLNPISKAMQGVLDTLQEHRLEKESSTLQAFYDSVKLRAEGIDNAAGKQKIVVELYDKFFRNAFPRMTERLGIVYTPVEVVDFIIHSVAHVLKTEFGQTLGSKGVHIIDPFTGTGTFITRLLQSGLIKPEELPHKYQHEIHANEIVLLAYYIAAINIEAVYHGVVGGDYQPFDGICLTDTFQMYEKEDLLGALMVDNSERRKRQKKLDIRVIMANPPYSDGQDSANDINENIEYPQLDARIRSTYADRSNIRMVRSLYNSYIRAIRWASDRIGDAGVVGFVTNAGFLEAISADGMRRCLVEEFSNIYVFHLRGNARTSGELRRREKDNVFGVGTRAPIAISILVKNPATKQPGQIRFLDIGDYLTREQKLDKVRQFGSIAGVTEATGWQIVSPDDHGDWFKQREAVFESYMPMGDKRAKTASLFASYSNGVKSNRDAWVFNSSKVRLADAVERMTRFFNAESKRYAAAKARGDAPSVDAFIAVDRAQISWADDLKRAVQVGRTLKVDEGAFVHSLYRPFSKQWLYMDRRYLWSLYLVPRIFPSASAQNLAIVLHGPGEVLPFTVLMTELTPNVHLLHGGQCFPLYLYEDDVDEECAEQFQESLKLGENSSATNPKRRDAITDEGLGYFQAAYPGEAIAKEDIFYYVYGLLHSTAYRERFADNLGKELPRIPCVKTMTDFRAFSQAGRALAKLHVDYESVSKYPAKVDTGDKPLTDADYRVEKMKFGKSGKDKDRSTVHYNDRITVRGIPLEAYDYVVNGKPAIEWVMERQAVKTDKDSGIVSDANDWAVETMANPRYPLELLLRVVTVSLETMSIVKALPDLDI